MLFHIYTPSHGGQTFTCTCIVKLWYITNDDLFNRPVPLYSTYMYRVPTPWPEFCREIHKGSSPSSVIGHAGWCSFVHFLLFYADIVSTLYKTAQWQWCRYVHVDCAVLYNMHISAQQRGCRYVHVGFAVHNCICEGGAYMY